MKLEQRSVKSKCMGEKWPMLSDRKKSESGTGMCSRMRGEVELECVGIITTVTFCYDYGR